VPHASIAAYFHKALDIHGHSLAQVSFYHAVPLDYISNAHGFIFGKIFHFGIDVDAAFLTDLDGPTSANSENIGQPDLHRFVYGQINSSYSSQCVPPFQIAACRPPLAPSDPLHPSRFSIRLPLALLMLGIDAQDVDHPLSADDLAFAANLFYRCPNFHDSRPFQSHDQEHADTRHGGRCSEAVTIYTCKRYARESDHRAKVPPESYPPEECE
jgi:hypothetical protein